VSPAEAPDLRAKILEASVELIQDKGLGALSMREVARRAGVSHQAPYHHFEDREAILGAVAEEGFTMLRERLARVASKGSVAARVGAMGRAYVEFACAHPAHFRLMFRPELMNLAKCPGAQAAGDRAFDHLTEVVRDAFKAGLTAFPSESAVVAYVWSVAHGLACLILDGPLAKKMPASEQRAQIKDVMAVAELMVEGAIARGEQAK
jgi:AcrR family transcriptional regulator